MEACLYVAQESPSEEYVPLIKRLYHASKPDAIFVDRTGMGAPILKLINKAVRGAEIEGIHLSNAEKEKIVYNLTSHFEGGSIIIPDDEELIKQLHRLKGTKLPSGLVKFTGKSFGKDDDLVWALGLAVYPSIGADDEEPVDVEQYDRNYDKAPIKVLERQLQERMFEDGESDSFFYN